MNIIKYIWVVCILVGCSSGIEKGNEQYKGTLSYKVSNYIENNNCYSSLWSKKGKFFKSNDHLIFEYESSCDMKEFFIQECSNKGGVLEYESINTIWCIKNEIPLWGVSAKYNFIHEKYKTSDKEWLFDLKLLGYETEKEKEERLKKEVIKKREAEQEKRIIGYLYKSTLNGNPDDVLKGDIGDKICKIDEENSNNYKDYPEEWIFYFGYIENKTNKKILVRYYGHGNKNTYFDDVNNKIEWELPHGWMLCQ